MHSWFEQDETQGQAPIRESCLPELIMTEQYGVNHVLSKKEVLLNLALLSNNRIRIWRLQPFKIPAPNSLRAQTPNRITGYRETCR